MRVRALHLPGHRGVALITVLLVVALVTVLALDLAHANLARLGLLERRLESAQAWQVWRGGVEWARDILRQDARLGATDHGGEFWARGLANYPVEGGSLTGVLEDQQGLFNLNNLVRHGQVSAVELARYRRLLGELGLDADLAPALADWLDADREPLPGGAEDETYSQARPPYLAANRPLAELAELARVRGYTPAVRARLAPYVAALPGSTPLNVNTAAAPVLRAVLPPGAAAGVGGLLQARAERPFTDLADFRAHLAEGAADLDEADYSVGSRYFLLRLEVRQGRSLARGTALLDRSGGLPRVGRLRQGLERPLVLDNPMREDELTQGRSLGGP